jgi:hypothetical protein
VSKRKRDREPDPTRRSVLPMDLRVGDRFRDEIGEWEVAMLPFTMKQGKEVRARVRRADDESIVREVVWPAYERVEVKRGGSRE